MFETITSRDNGRLVELRKIRDGKDQSRIFIEGTRLVHEAIMSDLVLEFCFLTHHMAESETGQQAADRVSETFVLADKIFPSIVDTNTPQGIVVTGKRPDNSLSAIEENLQSPQHLPVVVFLNEINNPSNLGAILRTAEAAGVAGVVISTRSADVFSPKSIRASMGSAFRMAVWEGCEFDEVVAWADSKGLATTATDISAAEAYHEIDWRLPRLLIFGSEAHGLSDIDLATAKQKIIIPMNSEVESLNLAVSAGIILFEAKRQNLLI